MKIVQIFFPPTGGMFCLTDDGRIWGYAEHDKSWHLSSWNATAFMEPKPSEAPDPATAGAPA